jgi:NitT/TauT family transport system permease protein
VTIPDPVDTPAAAGPVVIIESPTVRDDPAKSRARRLASVVVPPLVLVVMLIGVWYFISYRVVERRFLLHPPHDVIQEGFLKWDNLHEILDGLRYTTKVASIGLAIAFLIAVGLAVAMSQSKLIERAVFPVLVALQAIPILSMVPLISIWFDTKTTSRVIVCVIIAFFPIVLNTLFGLVSAEAGLHDLLTLHHASRWTRLRRLMLPAALPAMFAGLRISAGLSVIGAIVGDFFFGRGERGLGQLIKQYAANTNEREQLLATVIVSSALGIAVFLTFGAMQSAVIGKWYDSKSGGGR